MKMRIKASIDRWRRARYVRNMHRRLVAGGQLLLPGIDAVVWSGYMGAAAQAAAPLTLSKEEHF